MTCPPCNNDCNQGRNCPARDIDPYTIPPQRSESFGKPSAWVGLTEDDRKQIKRKANYHWEMTTGEYAERIGELTEAKLKEKNT